MARKFFKPIFTAEAERKERIKNNPASKEENKSTWTGVNLMTVKATDMINYAKFDNPQAVLDKLKAKNYKETTFKDLEENILFNLYKKHQKHAFDYYNYSNGNDK